MKIAIVLNTSWNIYNFRMNFIRALQAEGHEIHTIAPADRYTKLLEDSGCIHHNIKMDSRGANPLKDIALIFQLGRVYRKLRPDVILHYTIKPNVYGTLAAAMLRIPVINNVCGLGTVFLKNNLTSAIAIGLYKLSFRFADKVFFQNHEDRELFLSKRLVAADATDLLQGSGIDLNHFKPVAVERNKKFTFLLISRLITDKGIFEYISAINQLKAKGTDFKFQLMGAADPGHKRGIKTEIINEWIQTGTVEYLGTTDDVRPFIHAADCIVLPSYREGTPRTLLEAASSAKPIIATDVPGCHQVVEHGVNGYLCRLKDANDLADKMEAMGKLDDATLLQFGVNGRDKMIADYDERLVISKYVELSAPFKKHFNSRMKVLETGIEGLYQIIPSVYSDHRGHFLEFFKSSKFKGLIGGIDYLQDNISFSKKNVLRGLHLQMAPAQQAKIVTVITGKVLDVVVDLRSGSATFGKTYQVELSAELKNQLIIPTGFAHGFSTLEDAHFLYKCSQEYDPTCETGIIWNDADLNIDWQVSDPILSDKDKHLPTLRELLGKSVISR